MHYALEALTDIFIRGSSHLKRSFLTKIETANPTDTKIILTALYCYDLLLLFLNATNDPCPYVTRKYTGLLKMIVGVLTTCHTSSPDASPCDFYLWSYVKDQVYVPPLPASIPELKVRIRTAT